MEEFNNARINKFLKQAIIIYYILMIVVACVLGIMAYSLLCRDWVIGYVVIFAVLHIQWLFFDIKTKFKEDRHFTPQYFVFMLTYTFPVVLIFWQINVYTILLLYILLPLIIMFRFYASKFMAYAVGCSLLYILAVIITSAKIQILQIDVKPDIIAKLNITILIAALCFIIVYFYFYHHILKQLNAKMTISAEEEQKMAIEENAQLKELYNKVIDYFEKKRPYLQQNYSLAMLAADLNTNTKYLSNAININFNGTFGGLLNKYRLQYAKKMLDEGLAEKYTMEYIYTMSGYSNRSTFYENFHRAFKITPLECQKMRNSNELASK